MYKITRCFFNDDKRKRTIKTGLTLEQAQAHCRDPETSSSTCTSSKRKAYTIKHGPWFDAFDET